MGGITMRLRRVTSRNWKGSNNALIHLAPMFLSSRTLEHWKYLTPAPLEVNPRWSTLPVHEGHHSPEEKGFRPAQDPARPERSRAAVDAAPAAPGRPGPNVPPPQPGPPQADHAFSLHPPPH